MIKPTIFEAINLSRYKKLKIEDFKYFDLNYKNEYNKFIVNSKRYIYYRNIFV